MNNDKQQIEKYVLVFLRHKKIRDFLNISVKIIYFLFLFTMILIILSLFGIVYWWTGILLLLFPVVIVFIYIFFKPVELDKYIIELDDDILADQSLVSFYELIISNNFNHLYYKILKDRIMNMFNSIESRSIYFVQLTNKVKISIVLIFVVFIFSFYAAVFQPLTGAVLAFEDIQDAAKYLAVREDLKETFSAEINRMRELEKELEEGNERSGEIEDSIENLKNEIANQISALRRDSLSSLIEEKKITPDLGLNLYKLLDEGLTLEDSRELVLDLLSDESITKKQRNYIQKSYEDYSSNSETENPKKLGEDIIDSLSPELNEKVEAMEDAVSFLDNALEKLQDSSESDVLADGGTPAAPSESSKQQGQNGDSIDQMDMDKNTYLRGSGKDKNKSNKQDDFIPHDNPELKAQFPEGQIIIEGNTGILRLQADEELQLERIAGIYDSTPFEEGVIRDYDIPETMKNFVKEYFLTIGGISMED